VQKRFKYTDRIESARSRNPMAINIKTSLNTSSIMRIFLRSPIIIWLHSSYLINDYYWVY